MKKLLALFWMALLCFALPQAVWANTLPSRWEGTSGNELRVAEGCPVQVKRERLTFRVNPRKAGYTAESTVTAVYALYNPTDAVCTFPAVFPVVLTRRQQAMDEQAVLLNGEPLPVTAYQADYSEQKILDGLTPSQLLENCVPENVWKDYVQGNDSTGIRLLAFELELQPGETAKLQLQTVTEAFMEEERIFSRIPTETRYTFYYYLSPAQYWGSFENITIDLRLSPKAPVLADSSLCFIPAGPCRYIYHGDALPDGELIFTAKSTILLTVLRWLTRLGQLLCAVIILLYIYRRICKKDA